MTIQLQGKWDFCNDCGSPFLRGEAMSTDKKLEWAIAVIEQDAEPDNIGIAAKIILAALRSRAWIPDELVRLSEKATPGVFEYGFDNDRQVPCVIGDGLVDRSCVARFADDPEGHADAQLFAALVNWFRSLPPLPKEKL
jgi:phage major head subunit gpT-like protein